MLDLPPVSSPALDAFVPLAEQYCALIETRDQIDNAALITRAHVLIARLYVAGLALPPTDIMFEGRKDAPQDADQSLPEFVKDPYDGDQQEWSALYEALRSRLGKWCDYREIFNPYDPPTERELTSSLADDFADIYRDLRNGLRKWARGDSGGALWGWRFGLENHWGEHATGALRALHALASNYETSWPPSQPGAA